ncbi:MAG: FkbM family methyltransferase, partial [Pseudomonadota bacterium]
EAAPDFDLAELEPGPTLTDDGDDEITDAAAASLLDDDDGDVFTGDASVEDMMLYEPPPYTEGGFALPPPTGGAEEAPPDPFPEAVPGLASDDVAGTAETQDADPAPDLEPDAGAKTLDPPPVRRLAGAPPPHAPALDEKLLPLPSALRGPRGRPRFFMPLAREDFRDPDIVALCRHEADFGGWRRAVRAFLDHHLMPGDALIDVGAHWGVFAMSAATRWPGEVSAIAIEPEPVNVERMRRWIEANRLGAVVEVAAIAAGDAPGNRAFRYGPGSMSHAAVDAAEGDFVAQVGTIDDLLSARPGFASRRLFLKVDADRDGPAAIRGAKRTIREDRIAAVLWTRGPTADRDPGRADFLETLDMLSGEGFTHHRLP